MTTLAVRATGEELMDADDLDPAVYAAVVEASGGPKHEFEILFELSLDHALVTTWEHWGSAQAWPSYRRWKATS